VRHKPVAKQERQDVVAVLRRVDHRLPPASPGRGIDQAPVIGPEAREGGRVVSADQDIEAVDLVEGEPVERLAPFAAATLPGRRTPKPWATEAMRRASAGESYHLRLASQPTPAA
jgi:hypothetical protein